MTERLHDFKPQNNMINIRQATAEDAEKIIDFQQKMALETEQLKLDNETVTNGVLAVFADLSKGQYWVAEDKGTVIASLLITYEWSDWRNTNLWWFQSVYVVPEYRRTGIFRAMFKCIKQKADENGIAGLRLYVESNNLGAQHTYEALGMLSIHYKMYEWMND